MRLALTVRVARGGGAGGGAWGGAYESDERIILSYVGYVYNDVINV